MSLPLSAVAAALRRAEPSFTTVVSSSSVSRLRLLRRASIKALSGGSVAVTVTPAWSHASAFVSAIASDAG